MQMDTEKTVHFIDKFREQTVLWDPGLLEHYKNNLGTRKEICKKKMTVASSQFCRRTS